MKRPIHFKFEKGKFYIFRPKMDKYPLVPISVSRALDYVTVLAVNNLARMRMGMVSQGHIPAGDMVPWDGDPTDHPLWDDLDPRLQQWDHGFMGSGWEPKYPQGCPELVYAVRTPWYGQTPPMTFWSTHWADALARFNRSRVAHLDEPLMHLPDGHRVARFDAIKSPVKRKNSLVPFANLNALNKSVLVRGRVGSWVSDVYPVKIAIHMVRQEYCREHGLRQMQRSWVDFQYVEEKRLTTLRQYYKTFPRRSFDNPWTPEEYEEILSKPTPTDTGSNRRGPDPLEGKAVVTAREAMLLLERLDIPHQPYSDLVALKSQLTHGLKDRPLNQTMWSRFISEATKAKTK